MNPENSRDLIELSKADKDNFKDFLFYDIEVFKEDTIVVFKDIDDTKTKIFHDDFDGIESYVKGKVLVGYNNYHYDDIILSGILAGLEQPEIKQRNDEIIKGHAPIQALNENIFSLDCFQQINVAKSSLKKVEANIGMDIEETKVPFDIDRRLNDSEYSDTVKYCCHDVKATITIFKLRWYSYFVPKLQVTAMLPEKDDRGYEIDRMKALRWNTTTITANVLIPNVGAKIGKDWGEFKLSNTGNYMRDANKKIEMLELVPAEVKKMWIDTEQTKKKITVESFDCSIEFGQGGLHGVNQNVKRADNVKLLDVTSLYPNIILHLEGLRNRTNTYRDIVERRMKIKHKDPVQSNALKLVINSTYGLMKNEYSKIYQPNVALSVCIFGQIALYDLCSRLYDEGYSLLNINTDGVAFFGNPSGSKTFEDVQKEWEEDYGFSLELSEFDRWIQKDVNNYIAKKGDKVKVKGGMVNHFYDPIDYTTDPLHLNAGVNWSGTNSLGIIHLCVVNKVMFEQSITETVKDNMDKPILFQYILQAGKTYKGVFDESGVEYNKVNRVFAAKDGVRLYKHKEMENGQVSKQLFPNAPENMYVFNGDLNDFDDFKSVVDFNWYIDLAKEKVKMWTN